MEAVFLKLVNLSITAGWLVLAVLLVRLVFRRIPKWIYCILWGLVAIRLICPFSIESALSLIPSAEPLPADIIYTAQPQINTGIAVINNSVNPVLAESFAPDPLSSANPTQVWSLILAVLWIIGCTGMLLYALISYILLRRRVSTATLMKQPEEESSAYKVSSDDNEYSFTSEESLESSTGKMSSVSRRVKILQSENVTSPFVLGLIRPRIYLPYGVDGDSLQYIIAHEKAHISRFDHWWKFLGFLLLAVYWFNPLMWIAYILLCRDIEAACDEKVIGTMEKEDRQAYSTALLDASLHVSRRRIAACPLAFGEVNVKSRIKNVMNYKKPLFWIIVTAVAACVVLAVCFLTDPKTKSSADAGEETPDSTRTVSVNSLSDILDALDALDRGFVLSDEVYDKIAENWADWDKKDPAVKMLSSSTPGGFMKYFESWEEAVNFTGVNPWNPFENAQWLDKLNVYGADIKNGDVLEHCSFTAYADRDGKLYNADLSAGYASGTTRVVLNIYMCPIDISDRNYGSDSVIKHITINRTGTDGQSAGGTGCQCTVATRKGEKYDAIDIIFSTDSGRKYFIYITSYEGTEELARVFDKVCYELGLKYLTEDRLFNEIQSDSLSITYGTIIAATPTPLPDTAIPGIDANDETDYFINTIPGTDSNNETDYFIIPGSDDVSSSSLTIDYIAEGPMKPYDTTATGEMGGYFFIPIDGKIYRYRLDSGYTDGVTKTGLIFEFVRKHLDEESSYLIYGIAESLDHKVLYASWTSSYGHTDSCLLTYWPTESAADGDLEKVVSDGFVVMDNGSVAYNRDKWSEFLEKTTAGQPASVRLGYYYTLDKERCSAEYYEAVKDDYPSLYLNELVYDGSQYTISPLHRNGDGYIVYVEPGVDNPVSTWKYLMHYTGTPAASTLQYDKYVLTNDDTVTWADIERGLFSSVAGSGIAHREVYNEYIR